MMPSPDSVRLILVTGMLAMTLLAAFYLQRRVLTLKAYIAWSLVLIWLPVLGPFLVILMRPGKAFRG